MTLTRFRFLLFLLLVLSSAETTAAGFSYIKKQRSNQDSITYISPFYDDNERCFKCHGQRVYEYTNENLGRQVKALMFSERIVDRNKFYQSNHKSFSCTDCHSKEYTKFPHPGELRMEQIYNCIDCHGGDEKFARFHFEEIEAEYKKSVHFKLEEEGFSCWKCHGPHDYKISIRNNTNLKETILYDNNICLNCHANFSHFQLLTEREEINILKKHEWLPNQATHFKSVRCIECHAEINDTVLVSHLIKPKEEAVKRCNECHSQNSLLMSTLYKFESKEQRKDGFFNGIILNQSYVIGANRNEYLNVISLVISAVIIIIIGVHTYFRVTRKRN
jgi:Zn finger protein HypA/HybF involved in hydrogenase expression